MKKIVLILLLGVFTFGSSGFKSFNNRHVEDDGASCFDLARGIVLAVYGEINLNNVQLVLDINKACEKGDITPTN